MCSFGLSKMILDEICKTLESFPFVVRAAIFGSRAKGNFRKYSDIDIVLFGNIDRFDAENVRSALENLDTIYYFDVVSYDTITNSALREAIAKNAKLIYQSVGRIHSCCPYALAVEKN
ncbi:MAG: nucleotidyltransferase domain-containing protein [Clostridiales bacterium]|nr:nucleotidyltransferase domain-containing protein [Clostridiales bacterium]